MKIIFMGTPDFAAASLRALIEAGHEILLVVTQPDRPKGRSEKLIPSPVKEVALEAGIPVFQPLRIKKPEEVAKLKEYDADCYVVAAFGQILSQEILDIPKYGCLNIHASLLPQYRGAAPIQQAILDGCEKTGVTIQQMNAGIDTGDILYTIETPITEEDTFETLHDKLMEIGGKAITELLPLLDSGKVTPVKQNDEESSYVKQISKEQGRIDFSKTAIQIDRQIRGMNPWPSAFTYLKGKQLKIWKAKPFSDTEYAGLTSGESIKGGVNQNGEIVLVSKDSFDVKTAEGILRVYELQLEGKKRMTTQAFLLGMKLEAGIVLGA